MKLKKRKKSGRMRGHGMGTHGWGARKKHISSGNRGGFGMSGTGKMAGHKKTLIVSLYGAGNYFGKQGLTSRGSARRHNLVMNVSDIEQNFESLKKKFGEKDGTLNLEDYKILGDGEITMKLSIKAKAASESARSKIEKAGGKLFIKEANLERKEGKKQEKPQKQ